MRGKTKLPGLYQKTDSKIWYYQPPQVRGIRPKPISLHTKDEKEARLKYHEKAAGTFRGRAASRASVEIVRFLTIKTRERKHTAMSRRNGEVILGLFTTFSGNRLVHEFTEEHVIQWRESLREKNLSEQTQRTYLRWVSAWFKWLENDGMIAKSPMAKIHIPKGRKTRAERYCTKEERDQLLEASLANKDLAFLVWTGFLTGMRLNEMLEARPDWYDFGGNVVHVQVTDTFMPKDKEVRTIPMSTRYRTFIQGYGLRSPFMLRPEKAHGAWRHRVETKAWLAKFRLEHGMTWLTWHSLRHTYATLHILAGTPLPLVAKYLGDDYETTFKNYMGYMKNQGYEDATD